MMPMIPLRRFEVQRLAEQLVQSEHLKAFRILAESEVQGSPYPSVVLRSALQIERNEKKRDAMISLLERHIRKAEMGGR